MFIENSQLADVQNTGVVINHGQLAQAVYSYLFQFTLTNETTMMSFLPLAHIYEVRPVVPVPAS